MLSSKVLHYTGLFALAHSWEHAVIEVGVNGHVEINGILSQMFFT